MHLKIGCARDLDDPSLACRIAVQRGELDRTLILRALQRLHPVRVFRWVLREMVLILNYWTNAPTSSQWCRNMHQRKPIKCVLQDRRIWYAARWCASGIAVLPSEYESDYDVRCAVYCPYILPRFSRQDVYQATL
jgi:hypothetical protein